MDYKRRAYTVVLDLIFLCETELYFSLFAGVSELPTSAGHLWLGYSNDTNSYWTKSSEEHAMRILNHYPCNRNLVLDADIYVFTSESLY